MIKLSKVTGEAVLYRCIEGDRDTKVIELEAPEIDNDLHYTWTVKARIPLAAKCMNFSADQVGNVVRFKVPVAMTCYRGTAELQFEARNGKAVWKSGLYRIEIGKREIHLPTV